MIDRDGYRPNVGIVLCNWKNEVFWGKRVKEHSWQFPQGGIKPGETPEAAMYRELREEVVVVLSGRAGRMRAFLDAHPGLRARVARTVEFEDYSPEQLGGIFEGMAGAGGYTLDEGALDLLVRHFRGRPGEGSRGNGREARRMFEEALRAQAERIVAGGYRTVEDLTRIRPSDLEGVVAAGLTGTADGSDGGARAGALLARPPEPIESRFRIGYSSAALLLMTYKDPSSIRSVPCRAQIGSSEKNAISIEAEIHCQHAGEAPDHQRSARDEDEGGRVQRVFEVGEEGREVIGAEAPDVAHDRHFGQALGAAPAVDRERQCAAHAGVIERLLLGVERDHQVADPRRFANVDLAAGRAWLFRGARLLCGTGLLRCARVLRRTRIGARSRCRWLGRARITRIRGKGRGCAQGERYHPDRHQRPHNRFQLEIHGGPFRIYPAWLLTSRRTDSWQRRDFLSFVSPQMVSSLQRTGWLRKDFSRRTDFWPRRDCPVLSTAWGYTDCSGWTRIRLARPV